MEKLLCLILSTMILISLCACGNTDTSSDTEIIIEEEVVYNDTNSNVSETKSDDSTIQPDTSSTQDESQNSSNNVSSVTQETQANIYNLKDDAVLQNIKFNGRYQKTAGGISLNMSGSAIEFNTDSSSVMMEINAEK